MKSHVSIIAIATLLTSIPVYARPEQQTSNHAPEIPAETAPDSHAAPILSKHHVLPLDHGPHAQSTPWLNQQTRQREEKAEKLAPAQLKSAPPANKAQ